MPYKNPWQVERMGFFQTNTATKCMDNMTVRFRELGCTVQG